MTNEMSDADRASSAEENASESKSDQRPQDFVITHGLVETGFTPTTSETIDEDLADGTLPDTEEGQHPIRKRGAGDVPLKFAGLQLELVDLTSRKPGKPHVLIGKNLELNMFDVWRIAGIGVPSL